MKRHVIDIPMFYGADSKIFKLAKNLRKNMTRAELILWKKLRNRKLFNIKFRRQHPIGFFIVDFYNHELKLAIEVDGEVHNNKEAIDYDKVRTAELKKTGIRILRFQNHEVIYHIDSVITKIQKVISESTPL